MNLCVFNVDEAESHLELEYVFNIFIYYKAIQIALYSKLMSKAICI